MSEERQVWQAVRARLRALDSARSSSLSGYEQLLRAAPDAKNLETLYDNLETSVQEEDKCVGALTQMHFGRTGAAGHFAGASTSVRIGCGWRPRATQAPR